MSLQAESTVAADGGNRSYRQILSSTALIGGSSVINVLFSIIRNKAIAVLLGPEGVGLMGLYGSVMELAQAIVGGGVQGSGVRQIAEAAGKPDEDGLARRVAALKFLSMVLGLAGALTLVVFAAPIASLTFNDHAHSAGVALLAAAVFFRLLSSGQVAVIQGMRRIGDLARFNVLSAFYSTAFSIPLVYWFGAAGIVPAMVAIAAATVATSWWYCRKIDVDRASLPLRAVGQEGGVMLRLGLAFAVSALLTIGAGYAIRVIVIQDLGVAAAGLYQAAWALAALYAGFILQAMGADFYPRLSAVANDNAACNRLVNEQAQVSVLLAGPGLIATLTVAPWVITLFYTAEFQPAVELLRWICLGMMLRIVAWPMGFVVLAKNAQKMFFWSEVAATVVHVGLGWLLVREVGLSGAGIAFFGLYVWHSLLIYVLVRRLSGFRWSAENIRLGLTFLPATGLTFVAFQVLPTMQATVTGLAVTLLTGLYSLKMLLRMLPATRFPVLARLGLGKPA